MSLSDYLMSEDEANSKGISSLPDRPSESGMSAIDIKKAFDNLAKNVVGKNLNAVIKALIADDGASEIGVSLQGCDGENVKEVLVELMSVAKEFEKHSENEENPHKVSCEQIGAVDKDMVCDTLKNASNDDIVSVKALKEHSENVENPHKVSCEQIGAVASDKVVDDLSVMDNDAIPNVLAVKNAIGSAGGGDMLKATYDTQGKNEDIFSYADNLANELENNIEKISNKLGGVAFSVTDSGILEITYA